MNNNNNNNNKKGISGDILSISFSGILYSFSEHKVKTHLMIILYNNQL